MDVSRRKKLKKFFNFMLAVSFITFIIRGCVLGDKLEDELNLNMAFGRGEIYSIWRNKGHKYISYSYSIKGTQYNGSMDDLNIIRGDGDNDLFVGKTFPLIYDSLDLENSHLLVFPEQFKKYGFMMPDSLNWVKRFEEGKRPLW